MNKTTKTQIQKNVIWSSALDAIWSQMQDGDWYSLKELAFVGGCSEAGASARVRDLRKSANGGYTIEAQAGYGDTPWLYRMDILSGWE
jgi:hypothetical protein